MNERERERNLYLFTFFSICASIREKISSKKSRRLSRRKFATANVARPTSTVVPGVCALMLMEVSEADVADKFIA